MFLKGNAKKQAEVGARFLLDAVSLHSLTPLRLPKMARITTRSAPPRQILMTRSPLQRRLAPAHLHLPRLRKPLPPREAEVARRKLPPMPLPRLLLQILTLRRGVEAVRGSQSPLMVQQMSPRPLLRATPPRGAEAVRGNRAPPTRTATRLLRPLSQRVGGVGVVRRSQPKHKLLATMTKANPTNGEGRLERSTVETEDERESYLSIAGKQRTNLVARVPFFGFCNTNLISFSQSPSDSNHQQRSPSQHARRYHMLIQFVCYSRAHNGCAHHSISVSRTARVDSVISFSSKSPKG